MSLPTQVASRGCQDSSSVFEFSGPAGNVVSSVPCPPRGAPPVTVTAAAYQAQLYPSTKQQCYGFVTTVANIDAPPVPADVAINIIGPPVAPSLVVGDTFQFLVQVDMVAGDSPALNVVARVELPPGLEFVSAIGERCISASSRNALPAVCSAFAAATARTNAARIVLLLAGCTAQGRTVVCPIGLMETGQGVGFVLNVKGEQAGTFVANATVTTDTTETNLANNVDTADVRIKVRVSMQQQS